MSALPMIASDQLFKELIDSLRHVIAPSIPDPYPRTQAYMAAVILEFLSRQVEQRADLAAAKSRAMSALFTDLAKIPALSKVSGSLDINIAHRQSDEVMLSRLIEKLYQQRDELGDPAFADAQGRIRRTLRELLDLDLKIAGNAGS